MRSCAAVFHDIRSIHNVGSMFRTADAAGVLKIYLTGITPSPMLRTGGYDPRFSKVSLGAEKTVPWERRESLQELVAELRAKGHYIVVAEQDSRALPYYAFHAPEERDIVLVMGSETEGVPKDVVAAADATLEIPMAGAKESLNVAVAFGIVLFRLRFPYHAVG